MPVLIVIDSEDDAPVPAPPVAAIAPAPTGVKSEALLGAGETPSSLLVHTPSPPRVDPRSAVEIKGCAGGDTSASTNDGSTKHVATEDCAEDSDDGPMLDLLPPLPKRIPPRHPTVTEDCAEDSDDDGPVQGLPPLAPRVKLKRAPPSHPTDAERPRQHKRLDEKKEKEDAEPVSAALHAYEDELVVRILHGASEDPEVDHNPSIRSMLEKHREDIEPATPRPTPLRSSRSLREVTMTQRTHFTPEDGIKLVPARWPCRVVRLGDHYNPDDIRFQDVKPDRMCGCPHPCRVDTCDNARFYIFCDVMCCPYSGLCGNGLESSKYLQLMRNVKTKELTVVATNAIDKGVAIGEYLGKMKAETFTAGNRPVNSGYRLYMHHDPDHPTNQRVCIDAIKFGSLLAFVNHACFANVRFRQVCNGDQHTVVAVTNRRIMPGEEILANYGDELWFLCRCENVKCAHRVLIMNEKARAAREKEAREKAEKKAREKAKKEAREKAVQEKKAANDADDECELGESSDDFEG